MSAAGLRCRVCETVSRPEPVEACQRCDGPTDLTYDWDRIARDVSHRTIAAGPESLWRYGGLLPAGRSGRVTAPAGRRCTVPTASRSSSASICT